MTTKLLALLSIITVSASCSAGINEGSIQHNYIVTSGNPILSEFGLATTIQVINDFVHYNEILASNYKNIIDEHIKSSELYHVDENFFSQNSLILIEQFEGNAGLKFEVKSVFYRENEINIDISRFIRGSLPAVETSYFIFVEIGISDIDKDAVNVSFTDVRDEDHF